MSRRTPTRLIRAVVVDVQVRVRGPAGHHEVDELLECRASARPRRLVPQNAWNVGRPWLGRSVPTPVPNRYSRPSVESSTNGSPSMSKNRSPGDGSGSSAQATLRLDAPSASSGGRAARTWPVLACPPPAGVPVRGRAPAPARLVPSSVGRAGCGSSPSATPGRHADASSGARFACRVVMPATSDRWSSVAAACRHCTAQRQTSQWSTGSG